MILKRLWPTLALGGLCAFCAPRAALCQIQSGVPAATSLSLEQQSGGSVVAGIPDNPNLPSRMIDAMRASQARYFEGAALIQAGESAKARVNFDQAVDLILLSEWEISTIPTLQGFFQDLIRCIQRDESRYLRPDEGSHVESESAVVDELENLDLIPIQVEAALKDAVDADILNSKYDIPVIVNESVYKSMNYWLSKGRRYFIDGLSRSGRYQEIIERIFREEAVPRDLMYLAQVESLFKTNALSRALAMGMWQFTKGTAIRYGLKVNRYIDERSDPEKSTRAAARYLNDLYAMFNDWNLVLAAYNWGEGKVQSLINRSGVTDFWRLAELKRKMPAETKNHVPLIMASIILGRNPDKYGLPVELEDSMRYERVAIPKRVSLKAAAAALEMPLDELKRLNPALKSSHTPPNYPDFELNVPQGRGGDFAEKLASLSPADLKADPDFNGRYKVRPGDTLSMLAARYRISMEELQAANDLRTPQSLRAGAWLLVPGTAAAPRSSSSAVPAGGFNGRHQVASGETLASIAQRYGTTVTALQQANSITDAATLMAGAILQVPVVASPAFDPKSGTTRFHQVRSGETLHSIAGLYGVSVNLLQKINGIRSPESLQIGVMLQIPASDPPPPERIAINRKN